MRAVQTPPTGAASAVYLTLAAQVLSLGALVIFEEIRGRRLAGQIAALGGEARGSEAVVGAVTVFAVLMLLLVIATIAAAVAYLTWLVRARQTNSAAAPTAPALAAWLVPLVSLVAPVMVTDELWRESRPPLERRGRWLTLLTAWWTAWLVVQALIVFRLLESSPGELTGLGVPELLITVVAALLCAATVREITVVQRSTHAIPTLRRFQLPRSRQAARHAAPVESQSA
ncbi:DUF4328 domain-containing protein [Nonomuraea sp. NBC_01738]|uniref:DUF4328 domain-containing protein n=1 Tax=Nonomuraea sp. NBC_01738 TaxID=2976003 RepID=UPI002E1001E3|nr:DUF4328 domain-containing protein [Nonomuraea sp. NBC_01738]